MPSLAADAAPLPIDYRCDAAMDFASLAALPADGWIRSETGKVPGLRAGHACWLRIDVSRLAPQVLMISDDIPPAVASDATRLRQILLNLLSNAVKFTERGAVRLTVQRGHEGDRAQLLFAVRDTGIGLTEEGMARMSQRFSQADSGTARLYGGTGLGLAISKRLAELMGGTMTVESDGPGRGCTFRFSIHAPAAELPARAPEQRMRARRASGSTIWATPERASSSTSP